MKEIMISQAWMRALGNHDAYNANKVDKERIRIGNKEFYL